MSEQENQNAGEQSVETVPTEIGERNISAQLHAQSRTVEYSSPIPLPKILKGYKEVDPTFPERIMADFEKNSEHARNQERKALDAQIQEAKRGQYMAFFLSVALFCLILFSLYIGNDISAFISGLAFVGMLIKSFLPKKKDDN